MKKVYSCSMPKIISCCSSHFGNGCAGCAGVARVGSQIRVQYLGHNQDVSTVPLQQLVELLANRVLYGENGPYDAIGVRADCLVGAGAVEAPKAWLLNSHANPGLGTDLGGGLGPIYPNILFSSIVFPSYQHISVATPFIVYLRLPRRRANNSSYRSATIRDGTPTFLKGWHRLRAALETR